MDERLGKYRDLLVSMEQKAQEDFDKTVIALSGGALGISFAFVRGFAHDPPTTSYLLLVAWAAWAASITCILGSFYTSTLAMRKGIEQVDQEKIDNETPGGWATHATNLLNAVGGLAFLVGVVFMGMSIYQNGSG